VNKLEVFLKAGAVVILILEPTQGLHLGRFGGQDDCKMEFGHSVRRRARSCEGLTSVKVWAANGCKTAIPLLKVFCQVV